MENKKTKLTVSGKIKKTINDFEASRSQKKKTVIINNQSNKSHGKTVGNKTNRFKQSSGLFTFAIGSYSW